MLVDRFRKKAQRLRTLQFNDLIIFDSWRSSIVAIVLPLVITFFLYGFWWPYWRMADPDIWMIYEGWLFNDHLPQEWFDHPGYLTINLLGLWYHFLHLIGLMDVHALSELPDVTERADHAWTVAARAGRVLSLLLAIAYLLGFMALLRRITNDWRIAVLAGFALAFSGGFAIDARMIRTELIAGGGVTIALLLLIMAARRPSSNFRPMLLGIAAFCATLGFINKVQVIFLICALPVLVFPFGIVSTQSGNFWRTTRGAAIATALALTACAALVTIPAGHLIMEGLGAASARGWAPFMFGAYGAYQALILIWIAGSIVAFAVWWRVCAVEALAGLACALAGGALALLTLELRYNPHDVIAVINPIETLRMFTELDDPQAGGIMSLLRDLLDGIRIVALTRTFIFDTSARPTIFLEWFVIAGAISAWRAGHKTLAIQVTLLLITVWGFDAISTLRGLKQQYFILTDPLVIVAAALLLAQFAPLRDHRWAFRIGLVLMVAHVVISQAEPVKATFLTSKPMYFCPGHYGYAKRIERFPFCSLGAQL